MYFFKDTKMAEEKSDSVDELQLTYMTKNIVIENRIQKLNL